jgi:hypothetical protein
MRGMPTSDSRILVVGPRLVGLGVLPRVWLVVGLLGGLVGLLKYVIN